MRLPDDYDVPTVPGFLYPIEPRTLPKGRWVADLRFEMPLEKTVLVGKEPIRWFADETAQIAFAEALGRRRDRAALASPLVRAVGNTLRRRARKGGFRTMLKEEVHSVRLRIEEGSRSRPVSVRLHVIANAEVTGNVCTRFGDWWDEASPECEGVEITLLPTAFHDGRAMNLDIYDSAIKLDVGAG